MMKERKINMISEQKLVYILVTKKEMRVSSIKENAQMPKFFFPSWQSNMSCTL